MAGLPRPRTDVLLLGAVLGVFVIGYPVLLELAMERFGVRAVALSMLGLGIGSFLPQLRWRDRLGTGRAPQLGVLALATVAAIRDDRLALLFFPALVYTSLSWVFARSLGEPISTVERGARFLHPFAPDFIGPYCRKVTLAWSLFFLLNALVCAVLALAAPIEVWRSWTGGFVYVLMAGFMAVEFVIRKSWFRYFPGFYLDRLLARLLPPENTPQGRRSIEYVMRMRKELGMPPPPPPFGRRS